MESPSGAACHGAIGIPPRDAAVLVHLDEVDGMPAGNRPTTRLLESDAPVTARPAGIVDRDPEALSERRTEDRRTLRRHDERIASDLVVQEQVRSGRDPLPLR